MKPSRTTYLPFERWPVRDQLCWNGAVQAARLFGKQGAGAHWSSASRGTYMIGYGRYLGFLAATGRLADDVPPASRVTPSAVQQYHASLEGLADYIVVNLIDELHAVVRAMAPHENWSWLRAVARNLRRQGPRGRPKHQRVMDSKRLFDAGLALMVEAEARGKPVPRAGSFRDGLMLALLASRPVRRANLAMMTIGRHLTRCGGAWRLEFAADETKNRKPIELPLPTRLADPLEQYLRRHRPVLLRGRPDDALWISGRGHAMTGHAIYVKMIEVTKARLGRPINVNLFRDCLATSIAVRDPEHVRMATSLLGHNSARSTEDYYNQAQALEASRLFQQHLAELCGEFDDQVGIRGRQRR
jgi:site-specific recombinase XerD